MLNVFINIKEAFITLCCKFLYQIRLIKCWMIFHKHKRSITINVTVPFASINSSFKINTIYLNNKVRAVVVWDPKPNRIDSATMRAHKSTDLVPNRIRFKGLQVCILLLRHESDWNKIPSFKLITLRKKDCHPAISVSKRIIQILQYVCVQSIFCHITCSFVMLFFCSVIDMHGEINSFDSTTKHNHVSDPSSAPKLTDMNQVKRTPEKEPPPRRRRRKTKTQNSSIVTSQNSSTVTPLPGSETPEAEVKDCDKRLVFVVYGDDTNIETWIKREIEDKIKRDIRDLKLEYLHEGLETSHNRKIEYVTSRIRLCFKVLLVLSNWFEECKYCKYVLQMMVPNSTDKLLPVAMETCDTPTILSNISVLQSKKKSFITLLKKGLTDSPLPEQCKQFFMNLLHL